MRSNECSILESCKIGVNTPINLILPPYRFARKTHLHRRKKHSMHNNGHSIGHLILLTLIPQNCFKFSDENLKLTWMHFDTMYCVSLSAYTYTGKLKQFCGINAMRIKCSGECQWISCCSTEK